MQTLQAADSVQLELSTSPHRHSRWSTTRVMWTVVLALLPCLAAGLYFFGVRQLAVVAAAVLTANAAEVFAQRLRRRRISIQDGSATLTGLLLALTLPPDFPLSSAAIGAAVAILLGKQVFGGLGHNVFNPALVGRAFLQAAFPVAMTTWSLPQQTVDTLTSATPLAASKFEGLRQALLPMLLGNIGGCLGETSALAVLAGGVFLILVGIVNWRIPAAILAGSALFSAVLWLIDPRAYADPLYQLLGGGLLLGAFFMATDWVTSPVSNRGMLVFGLGIAFIVVFIRAFGGLPEGVMYAILLMNALVPLINRWTRPRLFGAPA